MDHRELPRTGAGEPAAPRRFARLVAANPGRRVALPRLAVGAVLGAFVCGSAVYLVLVAIAWVNRQPAHQIAFREITVEPPPPPWFRGGAPVFLDHVRNGNAASFPSETLSVLGCDLVELKAAFKKFAWVQGVGQIRKVNFHELVVPLVYRTPVLEVDAKGHRLVVDREGVIVPREDVDEKVLAALVRLKRPKPPYEPRVGEVMKVFDSEKGGASDDPLVQAAARLADFLQSSPGAQEGSPLPLIVALLVDDGKLWVQFEPDLMLRWDEVRGEEPPETLSTAEKWAALRKWFRENGTQAVQYPNFLMYSKGRVVVQKGEISAKDH